MACSAARRAATSLVRYPCNLEWNDAEALRCAARIAVAIDPQAGYRGKAAQRVGRQRRFMRRDGIHADALEGIDRCRERDRAHHVGRARFVALGRRGPGYFVGGHEADRAAAAHLGLALLEGVATADQRAHAERRVHLVAGEREVVDVARIVDRTHLDATVRRQLRGVDQDARTGRVGERRKAMDVRHVAGDVRSAGDGQQAHAAGVFAQQASGVFFVESPLARRLGCAAPWPVRAKADRCCGVRAAR